MVRDSTLFAVLEKTRGQPATRLEIKKGTGLSANTVAEAIMRLKALGLVVESDHRAGKWGTAPTFEITSEGYQHLLSHNLAQQNRAATQFTAEVAYA